MPHQLFLANIPLRCGTSARGAGPPSALGCGLAEHPPGVGELSPTTPQCPWLYLVNLRRSELEGHLWNQPSS